MNTRRDTCTDGICACYMHVILFNGCLNSEKSLHLAKPPFSHLHNRGDTTDVTNMRTQDGGPTSCRCAQAAFMHFPRLQKGKLLLLSQCTFSSSVSRRLISPGLPMFTWRGSCHVNHYLIPVPRLQLHVGQLSTVACDSAVGCRPLALLAWLEAGRQFCRAPELWPAVPIAFM